MRALAGVLAVVVAVAAGCATGGGKGEQTSGTSAAAGCVVRAEGRDVLLLAVEPQATCTLKDGSAHLQSKEGQVDIWLVRGARTVDEGVTRIPEQISTEFKEFKTTASTEMTVAGAAARRLSGTGSEADDGDPGQADVIVFSAGGRIFVACAHGESLLSSAQRWMATLVQSSRAP
jgi:hypothetical protein